MTPLSHLYLLLLQNGLVCLRNSSYDTGSCWFVQLAELLHGVPVRVLERSADQHVYFVNVSSAEYIEWVNRFAKERDADVSAAMVEPILVDIADVVARYPGGAILPTNGE